jgi:hypothetical protein
MHTCRGINQDHEHNMSTESVAPFLTVSEQAAMLPQYDHSHSCAKARSAQPGSFDIHATGLTRMPVRHQRGRSRHPCCWPSPARADKTPKAACECDPPTPETRRSRAHRCAQAGALQRRHSLIKHQKLQQVCSRHMPAGLDKDACHPVCKQVALPGWAPQEPQNLAHLGPSRRMRASGAQPLPRSVARTRNPAGAHTSGL